MQHFVVTPLAPDRVLPPPNVDTRGPEAWIQKARNLRTRRLRLLQQRLHVYG
jgi:hypothetical protein